MGLGLGLGLGLAEESESASSYAEESESASSYGFLTAPTSCDLGRGGKCRKRPREGGGGEIIIDGKCLRGHSVIRLRGLCAVEMNEKESTYAFRSTAAY